jgi:translation initiation factor 2B subunit (eIF-2B alpha/beta/delta family)
VEVVVVSESDKIATPGTMDEHAEEDNDPHEITDTWDLPGLKRNDESLKHCTIRNVYFEWVPSKWIDAYICERGILTSEDVMNISRKAEEMERGVFESLEASNHE